MDRKEFLEMCKSCASLPISVMGIKENVPEELQVVFDGIAYYPKEYCLWFDASGSVKHSVILHGLKTHTEVRCPLDKVERKE